MTVLVLCFGALILVFLFVLVGVLGTIKAELAKLVTCYQLHVQILQRSAADCTRMTNIIERSDPTIARVPASVSGGPH